MPPSAISRMENDNLVAPSVLNPNVPRHVSNVIMQGLSLNSGERIQTVTELVTRLFDEHTEEENRYGGYQNGFEPAGYPNQPGYEENPYQDYGNQPDYDDQNYQNYDNGYSDDYAYDDYQEEDDYAQSQKAGAVDRLKVPIIVGIVLLLILLIVVFVVAGDLFKGDSSESSKTTTAVSETTEITEMQEATTTAVGDSVMPQLVGKNFENAKTQYASWITFDEEEVYSDEYAVGQICWQEYEVGATFDSSKKVKVQVSKGSATVEIPSYSGKGHTSYAEKLDELGIPYTETAETNSGYSNGSVIRIEVTKNGQETDLDSGDTINLNDKYQIIVYYAYNPEPETTAPPETEPAEETTDAATSAPADQQATEPQQTDAPPAQ